MFRIPIMCGSILVLASAAAADTPLKQALEEPTDGPLYSFDMTFQDGGDRATGRVDPSQPEGSRITVTYPPEAEQSKDFRKALAEMDKNAKGDIWCADLTEMIPPDASLLSETDTTATYTFEPVAVDKEDEKVFRHLTGTATVSKLDPYVMSFSMTALKPFKPVMVAKVETFDMAATCAPGPDGRAYVTRMDMKVSGKAMMKSFDQHSIQTISNLEPISGAADTGTGTP